MVLQLSLGQYRQMGIMDLVARNTQQYIELAVRLGTDAPYREAMRRRICAAKGLLFEDESVVHEWERFLRAV